MGLGAWADRDRKQLLLFCGLFLAAALAGWFFFSSAEEEPDVVLEVETHSAEQKREPGILVYVVGGVKRPGIYELPPGSRMYEAVQAAGDVIPYADMEAVNLSEEIYDGMKVHIPINIHRTTPVSGLMVNINTAGKEELIALPGIGEVTAQKIIAYRREYGFFQSKEDLKKVPSIGDGKYSQLADQITV